MGHELQGGAGRSDLSTSGVDVRAHDAASGHADIFPSRDEHADRFVGALGSRLFHATMMRSTFPTIRRRKTAPAQRMSSGHFGSARKGRSSRVLSR